MKLLKLFLLCAFLCSGTTHAQENYDWSSINQVGLIERNSEEHLHARLWRDYNQESAVKALDLLGPRLGSSAYRPLIKRLLLSEATLNDPSNANSPEFIAARLEKLISYGFLKEATQLLEKINNNADIPQTPELLLIQIKLSLLDTDLPAICLDVQAATDFYKENDSWSDLLNFCRLRFGGIEKINTETVQFKKYPALKDILINDFIQPENLTEALPILIAFQDEKITDIAYNTSAKQAYQMSDLAIKLLADKRYQNNETYLCYTIEASHRGIISSKQLEESYKSVTFGESILNNNDGEVTLHPCHVPAFFYQKLQTASKDSKAELVSALLISTKAITGNALSPMVNDIKDFIPAPERWAAAVILGINSVDFPETWNEDETLMPLRMLSKSEEIRIDALKSWYGNTRNKALFTENEIDPAAIHYISQILSSGNVNFNHKASSRIYENFFPLTYEKKISTVRLRI